jgi:AraC-like DNA-binding protein
VIAGVLDTKVAAAMSEILPVAGNLREAYDRTYETSLISFMRGRETVYTANDYDGYLAALEPFGEDDSIQQIIQDVRKGDKAVAATKLDSLFEGLRRLTYDECKFKITTVIYRIVKSFSLTVTLKSFESIEDVVEGFSSLPEIREWIVRIMDQIIEQHQDSFERTFARQDLIFEIIEYFRSHMADPQMSPESISQHVSLSTNYVRRIFKESTGTSLSRYIFEQRVETVKRHLATTDASMTEIAGQAGFLTRSGFFAAFKKATGMTPGAYRDRFRASTVDPVG